MWSYPTVSSALWYTKKTRVALASRRPLTTRQAVCQALTHSDGRSKESCFPPLSTWRMGKREGCLGRLHWSYRWSWKETEHEELTCTIHTYIVATCNIILHYALYLYAAIVHVTVWFVATISLAISNRTFVWPQNTPNTWKLPHTPAQLLGVYAQTRLCARLDLNHGHTRKSIRGKSAVRMREAADRLPHFRVQLTHDLHPRRR